MMNNGHYILRQLPIFTDNYIYILENNEQFWVVDPGEPDGVLRYQSQSNKKLSAILVTHHHPDHIGGIEKIVQSLNCDVYALADDTQRIPCVNQPIDFGRQLIDNLHVEVLNVAAHTRKHIAYVFDFEQIQLFRHAHDGREEEIGCYRDQRVLFVGDSLFLGGCGRLFEGNSRDLLRVMQLYAQQPRSAFVCCAHEYTVSNLKWAAHLHPSQEIVQRLSDVERMRAEQISTVPDVLEKEFQTNLFLMATLGHRDFPLLNISDIQNTQSYEVLAALRAHKDNFK